MKRTIIFTLFLVYLLHLTAQTKYEPTWESLDTRPTPQWFADAKFGIFIHWGLYSVPAWAPTGKDIGVYDKYAEWYWQRIGTENDDNKEMNRVRELFKAHHNETYGKGFNYQNFAALWKAENFKPDEWIEIIKKSGAKYVVLTSKHHEGFTLWPSAQSWNWNSVDVGPKRDICGELNTTIRNAGLHMGFYYSLYEWFNPLYLNDVNSYVEQRMIPQLKDLVMRYSPDILWTDGEWDYTSDTWKSKEYLSWLFTDSPVKNTVVVNDRWGKDTRGKHGSFFTTEYELVHDKKGFDKMVQKPVEECRGIGGSFGYNKNEGLNEYQSSKKLIHLLIKKVAAGGNLLLNIGPTADGRIPVIMQQRLNDMGEWLAVNGDAIYCTQKWTQPEGSAKQQNLYFTKKTNNLYAISTVWTTEPIVLKVSGKVRNVKLLGLEKPISFKQKGTLLTIYPPAYNPTEIKSNYAWVYKLENALN